MPFFISRAVSSVAAVYPLTSTSNNHSISIGKYLVSPLAKRLADGLYAASVSIRSGRGSASTDRVMRFKGSFFSENAAHRYAREQGLVWVAESRQPAASLGMVA